MPKRITGLETEYGCLIQTNQPSHLILSRVRDWLFENDRFGLIDLHDRDWDEPAGNGGFLFNGGRVYVDMGHLEYCTPECVNAVDVVRYDRAGDMLLLEALQSLELESEVSFFRNNMDHYTGATFGCHENYSLDRRAPLTRRNAYSLLAFLTLRVLLTGAGRVGASRIPGLRGERPASKEPGRFQISQRADFIQNDFFEWVQHNRAIINTRDEPLADPGRFRRLHLLHGDTNVLPASIFLKVGTTRLVLDLLEADALPEVELQDAVSSLRALSRNLKPPWTVRLANGQVADALELLLKFQERAAMLFRGSDAETDSILDLWMRSIDGLEQDSSRLVGILDWVTKESLLTRFCESEGTTFSDPLLESLDLEYHHLHPDRGLGWAVADRSGCWEPKGLRKALLQPPPDSRAHLRSGLMRRIQHEGLSYLLDWEWVEIPQRERIELSDPFAGSADVSNYL